MTVCYCILSLVAFLIGAQLQLSELVLLTGRYSYRPQLPQTVTLAAAVVAAAVMVFDLVTIRVDVVVAATVGSMVVWLFSEWLLARLSPRRLAVAVAWRVAVVGIGAMGLMGVIGPMGPISLIGLIGSIGHISPIGHMGLIGSCPLLPFVAMGACLRNSPFGVVCGKPFFLACHMARGRKTGLALGENSTRLGEADTRLGESDTHLGGDRRFSHGVRINVAERGIVPNTDRDVLHEVQALIDEVGQQGGGTLFFPRGRYLFNTAGKREFLQINHSHITLEGERDAQGRLLTELVNGGSTVCGERNPWLSPFFITTGEALQPSNIFWGIDFRKPKGLHMVSSSLSDPGSDGKILTPPLAAHVTADAPAGSRLLRVDDSSKVGRYILLGMYNTSPDGALIKEILGVAELREEWVTARRAGEEEAPSFQWLVEVGRVVDAHTVELVRPLLHDCLLRYEPVVCNVEMLEDIHIRHLQLNSRWNGLFHHHGLPLYYTVGQAQEMDYGWNAINMKRTAHSTVEDVEVSNFTNALYVQDSREVTVEHVSVEGYDGHQGLKVYCHTCDCTFRDITFRCHYADMMGGEGNAYANTFSHVRYLNPVFCPVDYDFHGFSEGPFSPPAFNVFDHCQGFRYIKGAGAVFMQPACATGNVWRQCIGEGERRGTQLFYAMSYRVKVGFTKYVTAIGFTIVVMMKQHCWSPAFAITTLTGKLESINRMGIPRPRHAQFFPGNKVEQMQTKAVVR